MPTIPTRTPKPKDDRDPFYQTKQWKLVRRSFFLEPTNTLCKCCKKNGISTLAFILDHILPRRWFPELEWEATNFQGLCRTCDQKKRRLERTIATREMAYTILKEYLLKGESHQV